jgi:hypothetical protein
MKLTKEHLKKIILSEIQAYQGYESEEEPELSPEHSEFVHELIDGMEKMYYAIENVKNIIEHSDIEPDDMDIDIDRELLLLRRAAKKFTKIVNREYKLELEDSGIDFYSDIR